MPISAAKASMSIVPSVCQCTPPRPGNYVPDILDEARHELEYILSMQVPRGEPLAGMVHHKIHDKEWTKLGTLPYEDPKLRWLHRPSTAETLRLAATAAQRTPPSPRV
jgi:endoglucanase